MINRKAVAVLGLALGFLIMLPVARASEMDQATKISFSQSVQIPGRVLPAGTYWFVVLKPDFVQIFNSDQTTLYATLHTISSEHGEAVEKTEITFADRGSMQPAAIVSWFYPGQSVGHEFVYSRHERMEIGQANMRTVPAANERN
jgi:Protein of unknown function (DUF2911)